MQGLSAVYADRSVPGDVFLTDQICYNEKAAPIEELLFYNLLYFVLYLLYFRSFFSCISI